MKILEALENLENRSCSMSEVVDLVNFFKKNEHPETRIRKLLRNLDIPEDSTGFEYLCTILFYRIRYNEKHSMDYYYSELAVHLKMEKKYVQNQIRHAIQTGSKSINFLSYTDRIGGSSFIQTQKFVDSISDFYKLLEFLATN